MYSNLEEASRRAAEGAEAISGKSFAPLREIKADLFYS